MQSRGIFEILGINPTQDFSVVKKSYIRKAKEVHPDKNPSAEAKEKFQQLNNAYHEVDTPEKLKAYFSRNQRIPAPAAPAAPPHFTDFQTFSQRSFSNENSNGLGTFSNDTVRIFIPNQLSELNTKYSSGQTKEDFLSQFNFERLAELLTSYLRNNRIQVGVTFEEAEEIICQHSLYDAIVIYEVNVSMSRLLERQSEKAMNPSSVSARNGDYFWLYENTKFIADDIFSLAPLKTVRGSPSIRASISLKDKWLCLDKTDRYCENGVTVQNPKHVLSKTLPAASQSSMSDPLLDLDREQKEWKVALMKMILSEAMLKTNIMKTDPDFPRMWREINTSMPPMDLFSLVLRSDCALLRWHSSANENSLENRENTNRSLTLFQSVNTPSEIEKLILKGKELFSTSSLTVAGPMKK